MGGTFNKTNRTQTCRGVYQTRIVQNEYEVVVRKKDVTQIGLGTATTQKFQKNFQPSFRSREIRFSPKVETSELSAVKWTVSDG